MTNNILQVDKFKDMSREPGTDEYETASKEKVRQGATTPKPTLDHEK